MGHPPAAVWSYTPRRIVGFLHFASLRRKREMARDLVTGFNASRGKPADLRRTLKDLEKE